LSDEINVAGRKVSPETIEQVLRQHPEVSECLVLGVPSRDAERAETIVAVVVSGGTEAALKRHLLQSLPAWQVPREWHFVEALSPGARGKLSRAEWRRRLGADQPA
jgi:acyl-CoA synthetase (AMP-forming)/AMP-acid ligase II